MDCFLRPVFKIEQSIRLYNHYKQTVVLYDKYPLPKTDTILATMNEGEKIAKIDLSQSYQQLALNPESRSLMT